MENINEVLSNELKVKPLEGDEIAVFKLIRSGIFDPVTGRLATPAGHILPGEDMIYDKGLKTSVRILNITGLKAIKRPGEKTIYDPEFEKLEFGGKSVITCNKEENDRYFYMKRMNANRDNPHRSNKRPPVFFEVNAKRDATASVNKFDYRVLAMTIVSEASEKELINMAFNLNKTEDPLLKVDMNLKGVFLKQAIGNVSETYPAELIMASEDDAAQTRVLVDRGLAGNIFMFDPHVDKRLWIWMRNAGEKGKKNIVKIEEGNDPVKGLVDYMLQAEGSEHKAELVTRVGGEKTYA